MVDVEVGEQDVLDVQFLPIDEVGYHLALGFTHHAWVDDHSIA